MKRNKSNCRHSNAYPTVSSGSVFIWCPDCGAHRLGEIVEGNVYTTVTKWIYPTGYDDVLKQIENIKKGK